MLSQVFVAWLLGRDQENTAHHCLRMVLSCLTVFSVEFTVI